MQTKWEDIGQIIDEFEIQYLSPIHHGYPKWKGGERWLRLLRANCGNNIVFTQGLSSREEPKGYEVYLETTEPIDAFSQSWQANLVYEVGKIIPNVHGLESRLQEQEFLSVQIVMDGAPGDWSLNDPNGNIGLFLGLQNPQLKSFKPPHFTPLNIKLLRPSELLFAINNGKEGRKKLAELIRNQGDVAVSSLDRIAVV